MDRRTLSAEYSDIGWKLIEEMPELAYLRGADISISFLKSEHAKKTKGKIIHAQCEKVSEKYKWGIPADFTITVFEPNCMEFDEEQFHEVEKRLDLINQLKSKYARKSGTIEEILERQESLQKEVEKLEDFEGYLIKKEAECKEEQNRFYELCEKVSAIRSKQAKKLAASMQSALEDLNFLQVCFEIEVRSGEEYVSKEGFDDVEFMISTNPGEPLMPLEKVLSGGELSRIMLALKVVFTNKDKIPTIIFDEIDIGISGSIASAVAKKMFYVSLDTQVFVVTHLPQIAVMSDNHFVVTKEVKNEKTYSYVNRLKEEEKVNEIARMIGGSDLTKLTIENARELVKLANDMKSEIKKE